MKFEFIDITKGDLEKIKKDAKWLGKRQTLARVRLLFQDFLTSTIETAEEFFSYEIAEKLDEYRDFLINREDDELDGNAEFVEIETCLFEFLDKLVEEIEETEWLETAAEIEELFNIL